MPLQTQKLPTGRYWWVRYNDVIICTKDTKKQAAQVLESLCSKFSIPVR